MEKRFLEPLPSRWLPGVGEKTEPRLKSAGLAFIGQVAATPVEMLRLIFGRQASMMREFAYGIDERPVIPVSAPAKSYSKQQTFEKDITDEEYIEAVVRSIVDRLMEGIRADKKAIRTITLRLRYNDMEEDARSESLNEPTNLEADVYLRLSLMLKKVWRRRVSIRMVSVKFSNVYDAIFYTEFPMENGFERGEANRKIANAIDTLRKVYGNDAVMRGHDLRLLKPPSEIANLVGRMEEENNEVYQTRIFVPRVLSKAGFVPLNVASYYSFLDSMLSTDAVVGIAQKYELKAVALTDSGNLHGAVEFFQKAKKAGIKPIIGVEIRIDGCPVWLYIENRRGYSNLCKLLSQSNPTLEFPDLNLSIIGNKAVEYDAEYDRDVYHKRNFMMSELEQYSEGLIIVGGHKGLSRFNGQSYRAIGREDLRKGETRNKNDVAVFPIRYGERGDWWKYDVVQSIRTRTLLGQRHPEKLAAGEYHF
ncbi:MAG TPA: PHP domain-containing protein, partial [Verrucomicrobiota bacterium]|nr:PHP domain-containing protein [Verrucomicrobiota bacterium]